MSTRALVLDDADAVLEEFVLKRMKCQVEIASSEQDALKRLQNKDFGLLILSEISPSGIWI